MDDNKIYAFPIPDVLTRDGFGIREGSDGMTLRDWFAGQSLPESYRQVSAEWDNPVIAKPFGATAASWIPITTAGVSYQIADAMLAAREMKP